MKTSIILLFLLLVFPITTQAEIVLPKIFGDNMVLQRDRQVVIWGRATTKGEKIVVKIAGKAYRTRAEVDSTWRVVLQPTKAGGNYILEISGENKIAFRNVTFGDIWICSGQNNMDMPLNKASDGRAEMLKAEFPMIRLFTVKKNYSSKPLQDIESEEGWLLSDIETAAHFSAVGYFFAKEIFTQTTVPIGIVQATYNGSKIESWLSADVLKTFPELREKVELIASNPNYLKEKKEEFEATSQKKWFEQLESLDEGFKDSIGGGWESPKINTKDWSEMYQPRVWSAKGHELADYSGSVWFRKKFVMPTFFKNKDLVLSLGGLHDYDFTYVNGKKVGQTYNSETNRIYKIPKEFLREGENEIVVFSIHFGGAGGFSGIADQVYLRSADKEDPIRYSLAGNWKFKAGFQLLDSKNIPTYPIFHGERNEPTLLYNAMIAPLQKFAVKGILWSQGEANVGVGKARQYQAFFQSLIQDWREKWRQQSGFLEELPFLYTQLAGYGKGSSQPAESSWSEMREVQSLMAKTKNVGMAITLDLGEEESMFFRSKREVGKRLAYQALKICYAKTNSFYTSPQFEAMSITDGNKLKLTFRMVGGGLVAKNQYGYLEGFAIAEENGKFQWAKAYISGYNTVIVSHDDMKNPAYVRYAWGDNPAANLFTKEGLPALPFRTDNRLYTATAPTSVAKSVQDE
ncbi:MAG: sialate O-acetylesterase [Cytophagales bacterium]|nr:MAG: sialate O-acetylesterase [Cytophagales bacterium]